MPKITPGTVLKIVILCFFVGWGLSLFDLTPLDLVRRFVDNVDEALAWLAGSAGTILSYILLGAVIVVPIWVLTLVYDYVKQRRG